MALYALSDLHLSFAKPKPMDIFSSIWNNHSQKILENWNNIITKDDTVIINGDVSWAINMQELMPDLHFIHSLNGKKIISNGNHDYWWGSTYKLNTLFDDIHFIKNDIIDYDDTYILCFFRGWLCPNDKYFTKSDFKTYNREASRLENLLEKSKKYDKKVILIGHFPPTNDKKEVSLFTKTIGKYKSIEKFIYGHLHNNYNSSFLGEFNKISYELVSCDYLNFTPKLIR